MGMVARRFDIFLINLDPIVGSEIRKTRPCVIISPDQMNRHIRTVIVALMTTKGGSYPTRVPCKFEDKQGHIVLDQIRTVDQARLVRKIGTIDKSARNKILAVLQEMFSP